MKRFGLTLLTCLCAQAWAENATENAHELPEIKVTAERINQPYQTPSAVSYIKKDEIGRDLNDVLRTSAGLYTGHDIGQGGVAVNLRGLEGIGRVNTTIDGVSQTFYQTNPAHGWNGNTVYVNEDFLAGAEVERGLSHGAAGGNALGGSMNFRTLSPNDLVMDGNQFGGRFTLRRGTNGYGNNGMAALAHWRKLDNGGSFGALVAFGGKVKGGYKNGAGELVAGDDVSDGAAAESSVHARNFMAKWEYAPNSHHSFKLAYMGNRSRTLNNHSPMNVATDSGQLQYRYKPLSDWLDVRADVAYTNSRQFLQKEDRDDDNGFHGRTTENPTWQFGLQNRSHFEWGEADFSLNYGIKSQRIRYGVDESKIDNPISSLILSRGSSNINNLFLESELKYGKWTLTGGARYEHYRYGGHMPAVDERYTYIIPRGGNMNFRQTRKHFNPYFGLAFQATDWLQLYGTYAHTSRAPTVQEFMSGSNNGSSSPYAINPYLKSETSRNRDIGFNIFKHGLLRNDDIARLKVNYFNNRVRNYIFEDRMYLCDDLSKCDIDTYLTGNGDISPLSLYLNHPNTTKIRGWEIEGGYDFGRAFINLSYTRSRTDMPINLQSEFLGNTQSQPESRLTLDIGTRWLDKRLTVGARLTRTTGDSTFGETTDDKPTRYRIPDGRPIYDVYAKYDINRYAKLFLNIENLTNTIYNYPLSRGTQGTGNNESSWANKGTGRGRTVSAGFTLQF